MKYVKVLVYVVVVLMGTATIYVTYRHYNGDQLLSVQTGSMVPAFYPGDAVATHRVTPQELKVGDVIAYRNPRDTRVIVSHRLIGINYQTGKLITHGDALDLQDMPFPSNLVVGKVYSVIPNAGLALDWLHKPMGLISVVYLPAALVLASEARRLAKQYSKPYYQLYGYSLKTR